jgi:hypothetical protein
LLSSNLWCSHVMLTHNASKTNPPKLWDNLFRICRQLTCLILANAVCDTGLVCGYLPSNSSATCLCVVFESTSHDLNAIYRFSDIITCKNNRYLLIILFSIFLTPCIFHTKTDTTANEYKAEWNDMLNWKVGLHSILYWNVTVYLVSTLCFVKLYNSHFSLLLYFIRNVYGIHINK